MISLVVAHDEALGIGKDGWMPWNLPEDLKHFKKVTNHHAILMGRTTFEAMKKPLPNRHTFVVTTNSTYSFDHDDVTIVHDFEALMNRFKYEEEVLYVCGGAKVYTQALPYVDEMWISFVDGVHPSDTYFPTYDSKEFVLKTKESKDGFTICHYLRK